MNNILIKNIVFKDFEVAAGSFNGGNNLFIKDCKVLNSNQNIPALSTLSQCQFDSKFLDILKSNYPNAYLKNKNGKRYINDIILNANNDMDRFLNSQLNSEKYNGILKNKANLLDGNAYGFSFNTKGPVVGDFKQLRTNESFGNENILIENTEISNIITKPVEIIGYGYKSDIEKPEELGYGKSQIVGPVGDVIDFNNVFDEQGFYIGNELTDIQLIINKYRKDKQNGGTANLSKKVIEDIENCKIPFSQIIKKHDLNPIEGRDSMAHIMKGNMGIFISQGKNVVIRNNKISNIVNKSEKKNHVLSESSGILLTGSTDIIIKSNLIDKILSENHKETDINFKNMNENVYII